MTIFCVVSRVLISHQKEKTTFTQGVEWITLMYLLYWTHMKRKDINNKWPRPVLSLFKTPQISRFESLTNQGESENLTKSRIYIFNIFFLWINQWQWQIICHFFLSAIAVKTLTHSRFGYIVENKNQKSQFSTHILNVLYKWCKEIKRMRENKIFKMLSSQSVNSHIWDFIRVRLLNQFIRRTTFVGEILCGFWQRSWKKKLKCINLSVLLFC